MFSARLETVRKSTPASPNPRLCRSELKTLQPALSRTWDMAPSPQALSQISPENFSLSISAYVAQAGVGKNSGPSRSAKRLIAGLKPPER